MENKGKALIVVLGIFLILVVVVNFTSGQSVGPGSTHCTPTDPLYHPHCTTLFENYVSESLLYENINNYNPLDPGFIANAAIWDLPSVHWELIDFKNPLVYAAFTPQNMAQLAKNPAKYLEMLNKFFSDCGIAPFKEAKVGVLTPKAICKFDILGISYDVNDLEMLKNGKFSFDQETGKLKYSAEGDMASAIDPSKAKDMIFESNGKKLMFGGERPFNTNFNEGSLTTDGQSFLINGAKNVNLDGYNLPPGANMEIPNANQITLSKDGIFADSLKGAKVTFPNGNVKNIAVSDTFTKMGDGSLQIAQSDQSGVYLTASGDKVAPFAGPNGKPALSDMEKFQQALSIASQLQQVLGSILPKDQGAGGTPPAGGSSSGSSSPTGSRGEFNPDALAVVPPGSQGSISNGRNNSGTTVDVDNSDPRNEESKLRTGNLQQGENDLTNVLVQIPGEGNTNPFDTLDSLNNVKDPGLQLTGDELSKILESLNGGSSTTGNVVLKRDVENGLVRYLSSIYMGRKGVAYQRVYFDPQTRKFVVRDPPAVRIIYKPSENPLKKPWNQPVS